MNAIYLSLSLAILMPATIAAQCAVNADIWPGSTNSSPLYLTSVFGKELYFTASHPTYNGEVFRWTQAGGVQQLKDINPNGAARPEGFAGCCTAMGPRVFFGAYKPGYGSELWMTDGTGVGTVMVKNINPGSSSSTPWLLQSFDDRVIFASNDGAHGVEPWITDGTSTGTFLLRDISAARSSSRPDRFTQLGDRMIFSAYDRVNGRSLWVTDGTTPGTIQLKSFPSGSGTLSSMDFVRVGSLAFFAVGTTSLWKTDGTVQGTSLVTNAHVLDMCACGNELFVSSRGSSSGYNLLRTDGTTTGTVTIKSFIGSGISGATELTCSLDRVFFRMSANPSIGNELYVTDGTSAGTYLVKDLEPSGSSSPVELIAVGNGVCFRANVQSDLELWFSDGTATGTQRLCDIDPNASSNPRDFVVCDGKLLFVADHPSVGRELMWIQTPGAVQTELGVGSRPDHPTLRVHGGAVPVFGSTIQLDAQGPAGHVGFMIAGLSQLPRPQVPFAWGGCDWVGALTPTAFSFGTSAQPGFSVPLPIPNQPALEGFGLNLQAAWFDPSATPFLQMSNGLQLVLGTTAPH